MRRVLAVTLLGLVSAACAVSDGDTGASPASGIRGVVLAGPQCPIETAESPCPPEPLAGVTVEVIRGGRVIAEATTDDRGEFSVHVSPGAYDVQAVPGQPGFVSSRTVHVVVSAGDVSRVGVLVDTGIR